MNRIFVFILSFVLFGCKPELTVEVDLPGSVASDDGTINCPTTCVREITGKQVITLTASEYSLFYPFHHWEGACSGTNPVCELELDPLLPVTVKAQFAYKGKKLGEVKFEDPNLQACIHESVPNYQYQSASLYSLDCRGMGIESLAGMEEVGSLHSHFLLDNNHIKDLSPLMGHRFVNGLYLRTNAIVDPMPLSEVTVYNRLMLEGNPDLDCGAMQYVVDNYLIPSAPEVPQCGIYPSFDGLEGGGPEKY